MRRIQAVTALFTTFAFLLCACAADPRLPGQRVQWSSPEECIAAHTAGGVVLGAIGGALVGILDGGGKKVGKDAAIGAASGGAIAFAYAWGACFAAFTKVKSEQTQGYQATKAEFRYEARQGTVTKVLDYTIDPAAIAPGDKPNMNASYYVMTPQDKEVTVTETLALKIYNDEKKIFEEVGSSSETIVMNPGRRIAKSEIPISPNAEEGKFFIVFKIAVQEQVDQMEMPLTITKNPEILAKAKEQSSLKHSKAEEPVSPAEPQSGVATAANYPVDIGSKDAAMSDRQILVTVEKANLREYPDLQSKILKIASKDEKYVRLNTINVSGKQWHQIRIEDGKTAWISASICRLLD